MSESNILSLIYPQQWIEIQGDYFKLSYITCVRKLELLKAGQWGFYFYTFEKVRLACYETKETAEVDHARLLKALGIE
jgi:hypothetical protein